LILLSLLLVTLGLVVPKLVAVVALDVLFGFIALRLIVPELIAIIALDVLLGFIV